MPAVPSHLKPRVRPTKNRFWIRKNTNEKVSKEAEREGTEQELSAERGQTPPKRKERKTRILQHTRSRNGSKGGQINLEGSGGDPICNAAQRSGHQSREAGKRRIGWLE